MKLPQNGIVSFLIRLADFQASSGAHMRLRVVEQRTAEYRILNTRLPCILRWVSETIEL
jgi:hypothetical protein